VGLRIEALTRRIRCIRAEPLVHELVELSKVAPVEGIDEMLSNLPDIAGRAWIRGTG
jgi:hypothetical protein